ncbi:hypothetical protein, partial [Aeromonas jandaei]|uniref:hypothetical protein n=1 Tax=Aeromonas jandaei TaxID=650 RepID=UPI001F375AF5
FLMLDAVSAHTDCLIQIVKERRSFCCCGSGILLNRLLESSLIYKGFSRLPTRLFALLLAVSMEAHYREIDHIGKGWNAIKSQKTALYWLFISTNKLCTDLSTERRKIRIVRGHNTALIWSPTMHLSCLLSFLFI